MKRLLKIFLVICLVLLSLSVKTSCTDTSNVDPAKLKQQIEEYEKELARLQSQANTLSNQIAQFNTQIQLTELKLEQTREKILLLGGRIDRLGVSMEELSQAFSSRVVETYKMARFGDPLFFLILSEDLSEVVSRFRYLQKIQEADREFLSRLQLAQETYKEEKTSQEELQEDYESQSQVLGAQKAAKDNLLASTRGEEKRYQQLLAEAKAQLAAFNRFINRQGGASLLSGQTKYIDGWGYYYNQRDNEWGNMAIGSSDSSMAEYGCLVTSVAMVATHYKKNVRPSDIAVIQAAFATPTAYMNKVWSGGGLNVTRESYSPSSEVLNGELNTGRPVIVGMYGNYSYPEHFIVILRRDGDNYIMNDPFIPDGGNRLLTDKYSVSDIKRIDKVIIN